MDLIKREDAIKAVSEPFDRKYWQYTTRSIRDTVKALKDIPSAEPKQGEWIPCSERLPENKHEPCLVNVIVDDAPNKVIISTFVAYDYQRGWIDAWMPLPEPWEGSDDERVR